jgi:hypothetical protein
MACAATHTCVLIAHDAVPRTNRDGSVTEIPPEHCPNGHPLQVLERDRCALAEARSRQAWAGVVLPHVQDNLVRTAVAGLAALAV